jgi:hypothetical protein
MRSLIRRSLPRCGSITTFLWPEQPEICILSARRGGADARADEGLDEVIAALRAFALIDRETIVDQRDRSSAPTRSVCTA